LNLFAYSAPQTLLGGFKGGHFAAEGRRERLGGRDGRTMPR